MGAGDAGHDGGEDFPGDGVGFGGEVGDEEVGAKEGSFVAGLAVREVGDVNNDLVHRNASEERARLAVDEDVGVFSFFGQGAGVSVAVADAENSGFGVA